MNRSLAAALIALAFTGGNIAATYADGMKSKPAQQRLQVLPAQNTPPKMPAPQNGLNVQAKPFPANCVTGFQKYDEYKGIKGGVPVVQRFNCRTAWIECPDFPAYAQTLLDYEIDQQATGNEGTRIRVKYICQGYDPAG